MGNWRSPSAIKLIVAASAAAFLAARMNLDLPRNIWAERYHQVAGQHLQAAIPIEAQVGKAVDTIPAPFPMDVVEASFPSQPPWFDDQVFHTHNPVIAFTKLNQQVVTSIGTREAEKGFTVRLSIRRSEKAMLLAEVSASWLNDTPSADAPARGNAQISEAHLYVSPGHKDGSVTAIKFVVKASNAWRGADVLMGAFDLDSKMLNNN